jgi:hypothetical protein
MIDSESFNSFAAESTRVAIGGSFGGIKIPQDGANDRQHNNDNNQTFA